MKRIICCISTSTLLLLFSGCATIIKGYDSRVELYFASDSLRVYTMDGEELRIVPEVFYTQRGRVEEKVVYLRSDRPHSLKLQEGSRTKFVSVYPKLNAGWLILDMICGGLPFFVDIYTGNWNHFENINAMIE